MKIYFTFSKSYALALCVFLLVAFSFLCTVSENKPQIKLESEAKRVLFLSGCGFKAGDPITVKTVTVPADFDEAYKCLDDALRLGGYDIGAYKGKQLTEYTYLAENDFIIHIIEDNEKLVGAVCVNFENGGIYPLAGEKIGTDKAG